VHDKLQSAVLVTGTSSGLGRAIALALAAKGYRKVFCGVRRLIDAPAEYSTCVPLVIDVTKPEAIANAVAEVNRLVEAEGLTLTAIVMNAGVTSMGAIEVVNIERVRECFDVNVFGLLRVVQAFLPTLRAARGSRVVLIGSEAGMISPVFYGAYAASKFALEAIADSLRAELLPYEVAVSLLQVGAHATAIVGKMSAQLEETTASHAATHAAYGGGAPPEPAGARLYEARLRSFLGLMSLSLRWNLLPSPAGPSAAVAHALGSARPRCRYLVGLDAWAVWGVARFVPSSLMDRLLLLLLPANGWGWLSRSSSAPR